MVKKKKKKQVDDECPTGVCGLNGVHNGGYDDDGDFGDELLDMVMGDDEPKVEKVPALVDLLPAQLVIEDRALQLGYMIGPLTQQHYKKALEVGGFLIVDRDAPAHYLDFAIPHGLPVTSGTVVMADHYDNVAVENRANNQRNGTHLKIGAMFHIHPSKGNQGLYHSGQDDAASLQLLGRMAKTTRVVHEAKFPLFEEAMRTEYGEGEYVLRGDALSDAIQRFVYPDEQMFKEVLRSFGIRVPRELNRDKFLGRLLDTIGKDTLEPRKVNYAVSFVFNNGGKGPYVKMTAEERFAISGKKNVTTIDNRSGLSIVKSNVGVNLPTEEEVLALIAERVVYNPPKPPAKKVIGAGGSQGGWQSWGRQGVAGAIGQWLDGTGQAGGAIPLSGSSTYYTRPVRKTVAERIASLDALVQAQEPDDQSDVYAELMGEEVEPVRAKPKAKSNLDVMDKSEEATYTNVEIIDLFVLKLGAYITEARHSWATYSTYLYELFDEGIGTYTKKDGYVGLKDSVMELGELVQDNPQIVERHTLRPYKFGHAGENLIKEYMAERDERTVDFMLSFGLAAGFPEMDAALESYVQDVLDYDQEEAPEGGE